MPAVPQLRDGPAWSLLPRGLAEAGAASISRFSVPSSLDVRRLMPRAFISKLSHELVRRQLPDGVPPGVIPAYYQGKEAGPPAGTVVGIVLGSVAAFLLVVWLLFALCGAAPGGAITAEEEVVVRRNPSRARRRHSRVRTTEVREVSRSPRRRERVVEVERRTSTTPRPRSRSILVEERVEAPRVPGDDMVEVIEEHSDIHPPPRRKRSNRQGGYRSVDPDQFAGGDYPQHPIIGNGRR